MADFNVKLKAGDDTSGFRTSSRGIAAPEARRVATDTSASILGESAVRAVQRKTQDFQDGFSLFNTAVGVVDDLVKESITSEVRGTVDQLHNEMGVGDVAKGEQAINAEPVPSELGVAERNLARLSKARERGVINENTYWARVESTSRQLRARYPGHRDYIDQRVSSISGGDPANQIMRNLQAQASAAASQGEESINKRNQLAKELIMKGVEVPNWDKKDYNTLLSESAPELRRRALREEEKASYELAKTKNEVTDTMVSRSAANLVNDSVRSVTAGVINPGGLSYKDLRSSIQEAAKNPSALSPEERSALRSNMNAFSTALRQDATDALMEQFGGDLDEKRIKDSLAPVEAFVSNLERSLADKDFGTLLELSDRVEASKKHDDISLTSKFPILRANAAVERTLGADAAKLFIQKSAAFKVPRDRVLLSEDLTRLFDSSQRTSVHEVMKQAEVRNIEEPGKYGEAITQSQIDIITNPGLNPDARTRAVEMLYGPRNSNFFTDIKPDQQELAFKRLVNPSIFGVVKQMKAEGNEQVYENYVGWSKNAFAQWFRKNADSVAARIDQAGVEMVFDKETGTIVANPTPPKDGKGDRTSMAFAQGARQNLVAGELKTFNALVTNMNEILKEEGIDPVQYYGGAFTNLGLIKPGTQLKTNEPKMKLGGPGKDLADRGTLSEQDLEIEAPGLNEVIQRGAAEGTAVELNELEKLAAEKRSAMDNAYRSQKQDDPKSIDDFDRSLNDYLEVRDEIYRLKGTYQEILRQRQELKGTISEETPVKKPKKSKQPKETPTS